MGMLVLTRSLDKSIEITVPGLRPILIKVLQIKGHQVSIRVDAPAEVVVHRQEVADRIREENRGNQPGR